MFSKLSDNRWFGSHRKTPLQVVYLMLVFLAIVLTGVRISKIQGPTTRSDTLAIVMVGRLVPSASNHPSNCQVADERTPLYH